MALLDSNFRIFFADIFREVHRRKTNEIFARSYIFAPDFEFVCVFDFQNVVNIFRSYKTFVAVSINQSVQRIPVSAR